MDLYIRKVVDLFWFLSGALCFRLAVLAEASSMAPLRCTTLLLLGIVPRTLSLQNGFNLPQLGWNSWNHFGCGVTEQDVRAHALKFPAQRPAQLDFVRMFSERLLGGCRSKTQPMLSSRRE